MSTNTYDGWCISGPTPIRPTCPSDLLALGFRAARWTYGRIARPPSLSYSWRSALARPDAALGPEILFLT